MGTSCGVFRIRATWESCLDWANCLGWANTVCLLYAYGMEKTERHIEERALHVASYVPRQHQLRRGWTKDRSPPMLSWLAASWLGHPAGFFQPNRGPLLVATCQHLTACLLQNSLCGSGLAGFLLGPAWVAGSGSSGWIAAWVVVHSRLSTLAGLLFAKHNAQF